MVVVQIHGYTQLVRAIKYPVRFSSSGFWNRLRLILEPPLPKNYIQAAYCTAVDIKRWASAIYNVCRTHHVLNDESKTDEQSCKYQKEAVFVLEESDRVKDAFHAMESGLTVVEIGKGNYTLHFGLTENTTSPHILESGTDDNSHEFVSACFLGFWHGPYNKTSEDTFLHYYLKSSASNFWDSEVAHDMKGKLGKVPNHILSDSLALFLLEQAAAVYYGQENVYEVN